MPRKPKYRKPYPPEFRREAVALYCRTDRTLGELAHDLGVSRESLRLWVAQAQVERGERDGHAGQVRASSSQSSPRDGRRVRMATAWRRRGRGGRRRGARDPAGGCAQRDSARRPSAP